MKFNGKILSACALLVAVATCHGSQKSYYIDNATNKSDNLGIPIYVGIYKMNKGGFITTPQKDGDIVVYDKTFLVQPGEHAKLDAIKLEAGEKQRIVFSASLDKLAKNILSKDAPKKDVFFISPGRMRYYEITGDVYKLKQSTKLLSQKPLGDASTQSYNLTKEFTALAQEKEARERAQKEQINKEQQEKKGAQGKLSDDKKSLSVQNETLSPVYAGLYTVVEGKVTNPKQKTFMLESGAYATFAQQKSKGVPQFIFSTSLNDLAQYVVNGKKTNGVISSPITPKTWYYKITDTPKGINLESASAQSRIKSDTSYLLSNVLKKTEQESKTAAASTGKANVGGEKLKQLGEKSQGLENQGQTFLERATALRKQQEGRS